MIYKHEAVITNFDAVAGFGYIKYTTTIRGRLVSMTAHFDISVFPEEQRKHIDNGLVLDVEIEKARMGFAVTRIHDIKGIDQEYKTYQVDGQLSFVNSLGRVGRMKLNTGEKAHISLAVLVRAGIHRTVKIGDVLTVMVRHGQSGSEVVRVIN